MAESLRILILEDNPADVELIQFELQEAGFVFTAKVVMTEEDFVRELQEFSADLILSDYDLPKFNGALALAEARRRCPNTPFILVTGAVSEDRAIEILTQGAKDYVLKSRLEQRLGPAVKRALAEADEHKKRKKAEEELREAHRTLEERVKIRTAELEAEIAARKKADEALRANEERQRLVLRSSSIGTFEVDLLTGEGQWNDTEFELLGLKPGDVKADPDTFFRFVHPDDIERLQNEWEKATRSGKLDAEFRMVRADGRVCWLAGKGGFIFDGHSAGHGTKTSEKPLRFMGVNFDITDRKKAEEEAHRLLTTVTGEKEKQAALINSIQDEIWFADTRKQFTLANPPALHEFGLSSDASAIDIQKFAESLEVYRPDGSARPLEEAPPLRALAGEVIKNQEEMIRTPATGEIRYRQVSSNPVRDAGGQIIGSVSVVRDITKRKKMENTLRVSEERFSKAFKNSPNAITITRLSDGKIIEGNDSVYELLGYNHDEVIGKTTLDLGIWADADERVKLTQSLAAKGFIRNQEFILLRKDRTRVIVDLSASLINIDNQPCFLTSFIDITKRKRAEEALSQSRKIFYDLVERSPFGTYIVDSEFRIAMMNTSSQNGAFINVRPIIGRLFDEAMRILWPEDVAAEIIGHFRHTLETGEPYYSPIFFSPRHDIEIVEGYEWELHRIMLPDGQYGVICYYFDSTKLREAEEALKESEQKYRSIFENSLDAIILAIPNKKVLAANPAACAIFGMTEEELCRVGRKGIEDPTDPRHAAAVEERARTGRVKYEATHVRMDGSRFPSEVSSVIMEGGQRSLVILRDITDRKRVEDELRKSEERFRGYFELGLIGMAITTMDKGITEVNKTFCDMIGYERSELRQMTWAQLTHPDDLAADLAHFNKVLTGEIDGYSIDKRLVRKDGDIIDATLSVKCVRTADESVDYFVALIQDITKRKRAEDALRESEGRLRRIAKAGRIGFFEWNASKDTAYWSPEHYELFGYEPGSPVSWQRWLKGVHPEDRERTAESASRLLECGRSAGQVRDHKDQYRYVRDDGSVVWMEADISVEMIEGEAIVSGSVRNISERKDAEIAMKCQTEQLEAANKELESFSYSVSHDLKAPLRAIDGFSRKLEREFGDKTDKKFTSTITVIRKNAKIMGNLIEDLLSFSRVQKAEMDIAVIDMHQLVAEVWNDIRDADKQLGLEFKANNILSGYGDRALIRQVLFNLLSNAVKFTKDRKPAIIEVTSYPESDNIVYRVMDNGAGFDMKYYDKLFGVFRRLHGEEYEGTGIGLAIVQRIVQRHGGRVWAEGQVDKGATFYFTLPSTQTG